MAAQLSRSIARGRFPSSARKAIIAGMRDADVSAHSTSVCVSFISWSPVPPQLFLFCSAASTNPLNSGCGLLGLDFNSGCACVATKKG